MMVESNGNLNKTCRAQVLPYIERIVKIPGKYVVIYKQEKKPYYTMSDVVAFGIVTRYEKDGDIINEFRDIEPLVYSPDGFEYAKEFSNYYGFYPKSSKVFKEAIKEIKAEMKKNNGL